jgi:hypothetical protein
MTEHMENRTLPASWGCGVSPNSHNLDHPDGTPVRDSEGRWLGMSMAGACRCPRSTTQNWI